jgi:hypothetical protein
VVDQIRILLGDKPRILSWDRTASNRARSTGQFRPAWKPLAISVALLCLLALLLLSR